MPQRLFLPVLPVHYSLSTFLTMLHLDGSQGEGGGQVLRTSLSLSALTGTPFRLENIRAGRPKPGLRPQHLTAVRAVADLCQASLKGDRVNSTMLDFVPGTRPQGGTYTFAVNDAAATHSAGAITLIFQALLWPLLFANEATALTLRGGTHVPFSPPYPYLAEVALPAYRRFGPNVSLKLDRYGWNPTGDGQMRATIQPVTQFQAAAFTPIPDETVQGLAVVTALPSHIPQRMERRAHNLLTALGLKSRIKPVREMGEHPGAGLFLWRPQAGFSALGAKGVPADKVAAAAVADLSHFIDNPSAVDPHLADQLLIPMALAHGSSYFTTSEITSHTLTNIAILRQWLNVSIQVVGEPGQPGQITITGIGFTRMNTQ